MFTTLDIVATLLAVLSLLSNSLVIYLITKMKLNTKDRKLAVVVLLVTASYDLLAPILTIIQIALDNEEGYNWMSVQINCQILGAFQTMIPYLTSGMVAIVALEKFRKIYQKSWTIESFYTLIIIDFFIGALFSTLAAAFNNYKLSSNEVICMVQYNLNVFGSLWYFVLVLMLLFHLSVMLYCYIMFVVVYKKVKFNLFKYQPQLSNTSINVIEPDGNFERSTYATNLRASTSTWFKTKQDINTFSKSFLTRALITMFTYILLIAPTVALCLYKPYLYYKSNGTKFVEMWAEFLPLVSTFLLAIINPMMLLFLHTGISEQLTITLTELRERLLS